MSERGRWFADHWVSENIHPGAYAPEGDNSRVRELAIAMIVEAKAQAISKQEIEEEVGDAVSFIAAAVEESTDEELRRLAEKDG